MAKKIKFPLVLKDEQQVRTMEELQEYFDLEKIFEYFSSGKLAVWLEDRYYDEEAGQVRELSPQDPDLKRKLCDIFSVECPKEDSIDLERVEERRKKRELLKQYTDDEKILERAGQAAFNQEELSDLLDEGVREIYLCNNRFTVPVKVKNCQYIGICKAVIEVRSKEDISFDDLGIVFENVEFSCLHDITIQAEQSKEVTGDGIAVRPLKEGYEFEVRQIKGYIQTDEVTDKKTWFPDAVENSVPEDTIQNVLYSRSFADGKEYFLGVLPNLGLMGEQNEDWRVNYDNLYQVSGDYVYFVNSGYESSMFERFKIKTDDDPYGFNSISVYNPTLSKIENPQLSYGIFRSKCNGQEKECICSEEEIKRSGGGIFEDVFGEISVGRAINANNFSPKGRVEEHIKNFFLMCIREIAVIAENNMLFMVFTQGEAEKLIALDIGDKSLTCLNESSPAERVILLNVNKDYIVYSLANKEESAIMKVDLKKKASEVIIKKTQNGYHDGHKDIGMFQEGCLYFLGDANTEEENKPRKESTGFHIIIPNVTLFVNTDTVKNLYAFKYDFSDHKLEVIKKLPPANYKEAYFTKEKDKIFLNYKSASGNEEEKTRVK